MMLSVDKKNILILIAVGVVALIVGNGIINLTNPDEVFYAQTAREMASHHSWMVPYLFDQPQFEKPILTYWLLRAGLIAFGATNFGARFFPALFALAGVIAVYYLAALGFKDRRKAFLSAFILMTSGLYIGLARTVFTDMIFSVFILLSLLSFYWGYTAARRKPAGLVLFFIFSGLAVLTKGPLGLIIPGAIVVFFLAARKECRFLWCAHAAWGFLLFLAIAAPWYLGMIRIYGHAFTHEFFYNDHVRRLFVAEHRANDTWFFYPASMILCMFPWSLFVAGALWRLFRRFRTLETEPFMLFLSCWILVVFSVFQVAHSKLVSYIFPLFPALAIAAGGFIAEAVALRRRLFFILIRVTWGVLACVPIAMLVSARKYADYVPPQAVLLSMIAALIAAIIAVAYAVFRRKAVLTMVLLGVQVPLLFVFGFIAEPNYDPFVSSKRSCEYLLSRHDVKGTVLCSKMNVRGVRYYTGWDVAVLGVGGGNFFSPHPIPYLDTKTKVKEFLATQPVTYGILSKSGVNDLKELVGELGLSLEILEKIGDKFIIKIT